MPRQYFINGESMITVKGTVSSPLIASVVQLGLTQDPIRIMEDFHHEDIRVDAYGKHNPPELQMFGSQALLSMNLVHYDPLVLQECIRLSMGGTNGAASEGQQSRAGTLMGGNQPLYAALNNYISVNILSPEGGVPWLFYACYLANRPVEYPLGTERSVVQLNWRAIAYSVDPWNNGTGSAGVPVYAHTTLV